MALDFESFSEDPGRVSESNLTFLAEKAAELNQLNNKLEDLNRQAKDVSLEIKRMNEEIIPNYMQELGLSEIKLSNGAKVTVKQQIFASIKKENEGQAFQWLEDHGHGDLIKTELKVNFGKGELDKAHNLRLVLRDMDIDAAVKPTVHWQTLRAFAKEQMEKGVQLPEDLIPTHVVPTAVIKEGKK